MLVALLLLACVVDHAAPSLGPLTMVAAQSSSSSSTGDSISSSSTGEISSSSTGGESTSSSSTGVASCTQSTQQCWNSTLCLSYVSTDAVPPPPELHLNDSCTNVTTPACVDAFDVVTMNVSHAGFQYNLTTDLFCMETVCDTIVTPCPDSSSSSSSSSGAAASSSSAEASSSTAESSSSTAASSSTGEMSSSSEPIEPFVTPAIFPTGIQPGDVPTGGPLAGGGQSSSSSSGGGSSSSSSGAYSSSTGASSSTGGGPSGPDAVTPVIDASSLVISPTTRLYSRAFALEFTLTLRVRTGYSGLSSIALGFEASPYNVSFSKYATSNLNNVPWVAARFTRTVETRSDCTLRTPCASCLAPLCTTCCVVPFAVDAAGGRWIQVPMLIEPTNSWSTNRPQIFPPALVSVESIVATGQNTLAATLPDYESVRSAIVAAGGQASSALLNYRSFMYMPASITGETDPSLPLFQIECFALEEPVAAACGFVSSAGGHMLSIVSPVCPSARCAELYMPFYRKCLQVTLSNQDLADTTAVLYPISADNSAMDLVVTESLIATAQALYDSAVGWRTPDFYYPPAGRAVDGSRDCPMLEAIVESTCQLSRVGTGLTVASQGIKPQWYNFPAVASLARCNYPQNCGPFLLNYTSLCLNQSFPWTLGANRWATPLLNLVAACTKSVSSVSDLRTALQAVPRAPLLLLDIPTPVAPAAIDQTSVGAGVIPGLELFRLKGGRELLVMWTPAAIGAANTMSYTIRAQLTSALPAVGHVNYTLPSTWKYSVSVSGSANAAVISTLTSEQSSIIATNPWSSLFYPPGLGTLGSWTVVIEGRNEFGVGFSYALPTTITPFNPIAPAPGRQCPNTSASPVCGSGITGSNPALRTVNVEFAPLVRDTGHYWDPNPAVCSSALIWDSTNPTTQCPSPFFSGYPISGISYSASSYVTYVTVVWAGTASYSDALLTQVACVFSRQLTAEGTAASGQPKVPCTIPRLAPGQRYRAAMMAINPFGSPTDLSVPVDLAGEASVPAALPAMVVDNAVPVSGGFVLRVSVVGNSVDAVGAIYIVNITCVTCVSGPFVALYTLTSPASFVWTSSLPAATTNGAPRMFPQAGFLYRFSLGAANKASYVLSSGAVPDVVSPPTFAFFAPMSSLPAVANLAWGTLTKGDGYLGNSVELSWNAPSNTLGLQRVLFYRVVLTTSDMSFVRSADVNQERFKFNGLPAGKSFSAYVTPVSAAGVGTLAALSGLTTDAAVTPAPTVRSLTALAPLSLLNVTSLSRPNMSCSSGLSFHNQTTESFAMTNYTWAYNASDPTDVAFIGSLGLNYTLVDGQNFTWAFNISLGMATTIVNETVYTCVNLTYPTPDYPVLATTILGPGNASVLQIRFDGPTDMGANSPLTGAQIADSYGFSSGGLGGWLKLYNSIPWSYVSAEGNVTLGMRDLLLDEIVGGWETSWNADGSVLSLTFLNWQQPPQDWNITLIDPVTGAESWYLHTPVPTVGSTFVHFTNGIAIRRTAAASNWFAGSTGVKLGGSWNLTHRAFTSDPLQQGLLTTLTPSTNGGVGPLVAWGSYTQPLQQYLRLSLQPLLNEIEWWGNLGNGGVYTLNCTARLGFVYPYAKSGTLAELQRFLHNSALPPGSPVFNSYDYYNAWRLSGYTFVYTAPYQTRAKDDVVTCSLWTQFAANYSGTDRTLDMPDFQFMLDQRQFPIRVLSVNREPTLLLPQGKITFPSSVNAEARAAGYDPNPIIVGVDSLRYLNFSLTDLDATMGTATTWNAHSAVRVHLRINSHALSPYAPSIRIANMSAAGLALNVSSIRSQVLSTSDPLTSDGAATVRLSREVGVDSKELLIVGPFVDVAAIMAGFVQVSFKQVDTAAHASALSGSLSFPSSVPDLPAPSHATGASLANVILTPYQLFPALMRSFLSVTVNDLGNLGSDVPTFAGSTQLVHFQVTCSDSSVAAPAITSAALSDTGDAVIVTWSTAISVAVSGKLVQSTAACLSLFDDAFFIAARGSSSGATTVASWQAGMSPLSPTALTNMPTCTLLASNIVRVGLATGHTLTVPFTVTPRTGAVKRCPSSTNAATGSAQLSAPLLPIAPTVRIFGPTLVSVCDDILFTTRVTGLARSSAATYDWSFTSLIMPDLVISNAFPRATVFDYPMNPSGVPPFVVPGGETMSIPRGVLRPDTTYKIGVTVTNRFGIVSERAEHTFTPTARPVPTVQIVMEPGNALLGGLTTVFVRGSPVLGAHSLYTPATPASATIPADAFTLHSMVNFSSCHPSANRALKYTWTITPAVASGAPAPTISSTNTQPSLTLDENSLYDDVDYTVELSVVSLSSIGSIELKGSYSAVFRIQAAPLTYAFAKGDAQVVAASESLQIEALIYDRSNPWYGMQAQPLRTCAAALGTGECVNKFQWTCTTASGSPCINELALDSAAPVLSLPTGSNIFTLAGGTLTPDTYRFSLVLTAPSALLNARITAPFNTLTHTVTITSAPSLAGPTLTLPPLFTLTCPVLNNGAFEFGLPILNHDQPLAVSVNHTLRATGNTARYTWMLTAAFNALTEYATDGVSIESATLNSAYGVPGPFSSQSALQFNAQATRNFWTPGTFLRVHVVVTEYNPAANFNSSANARCSYYVHAPPSGGSLVVSSTRLGSGGALVAQAPVYLSAPGWSHSLLSNPAPFNPFGSTSATHVPSLAFVNYAFYIRTAAGQSGYIPYTYSADTTDPNVRFLRAGYTSNVGLGGFITSLPGGTYYLGVLVRDVYGGASVAETLVTVSSGSSDPVAGAAAPDTFISTQAALVNTQLDGLTSGAIAGGSDAILDLASSTALLLNSFAVASGSLTGYPSGVTAATSWMVQATAIRTQLLTAVRNVVKPLLVGAPKTFSLPQSQIILLTSRVVASPAQMNLAQASTLLSFLEAYLLSDLRTTLTSSMSVSDYSTLLRMLGVVATSSAFAAAPPTSMPPTPTVSGSTGTANSTNSSSSSSSSSSSTGGVARRLFAVSDDPSVVVVGGSSSSAGAAGRAMLDEIYDTYSTALIYSELFILTSQTLSFFDGTASGPTPAAGLGVNSGVTRFTNGGSSGRITVAPGACYLTVRSISTDTTPVLLDARFIYIYTGADLYSWATPADAPVGPSNPNNSSYLYNYAPTVSVDLAFGSAPSIGTTYTTEWSSTTAIRYEFTLEFVVQFATTTLVTDTLWEFNCQRFDASSGEWTASDVSTTVNSRPNPWSITCVTRTPGVVTVAAYSTWIPPNLSSSGGSGGNNQSDGSSSTGPEAPLLLLDTASLSNTNLQLFLIVAGCIAVGTSCLVGLLACWCQRRSRAKEAARRAAEKIRKLELAKTRALREAAGNPVTSSKKKKNANKKTVVPAGGSAGVIKKPAMLSQGSFADLHKSQSQVPLGPVSPHNTAMGASGWMAAAPLPSPSGGDGHDPMDPNEDIHFSEDLYEGAEEPVAIRIAGAEDEEQKSSPGLAAAASPGREKKHGKKHGSSGKKDAKGGRTRSRSVAAEEEAHHDFDSDEDGHAKYNRHDQIHIDIAQEQPLVGETGLELNSDYSNMWYDPIATAAAAAELAALTGQSVAEVSAMLRAQQATELETGVGGASTIYSFDEHSPSKGAAVAAAGAPAAAAAAASINYDDFHVIEHAPTRTYDDSMLAFHGPLNNDPYLLAVYSPSHASNPANVPPPDLLRPGLMPGRMVDTSYSRPLVPAAWRLLHGHSPWGQTISFSVDSMPRWWKHHKGLDVSESKEELRRARVAARRVARKSKAPKKAVGVYAERYQQAASASSSSSSSSSKPSVLRASTAAPHRATKSDLRRQLSAAPVEEDASASSGGGAGFNFAPPSAAASKQARKDAAASKQQGLRPTRLQGVGTAALDTSLRLQNQRSLTNLVRDEPASSPHSQLASPSANFHALPSLGEDGDADGDHVGPLTERKDDERPRAGGAGQLSSRRHRGDEEGGRGGGGFGGGDDDSDGMQLMGGGGGDGGSTYRGYSSFQPSAFELEEAAPAPAKSRRSGR